MGFGFIVVAFKNFSGRCCCFICSLLLLSFLFSLMKSKETPVRSPTGGSRPLVTAFIETPASLQFIVNLQCVCFLCFFDNCKQNSSNFR